MKKWQPKNPRRNEHENSSGRIQAIPQYYFLEKLLFLARARSGGTVSHSFTHIFGLIAALWFMRPFEAKRSRIIFFKMAAEDKKNASAADLLIQGATEREKEMAANWIQNIRAAEAYAADGARRSAEFDAEFNKLRTALFEEKTDDSGSETMDRIRAFLLVLADAKQEDGLDYKAIYKATSLVLSFKRGAEFVNDYPFLAKNWVFHDQIIPFANECEMFCELIDLITSLSRDF